MLEILLYSIEYACISKFVLIQHILSTQVSDIAGFIILCYFVLFHICISSPRARGDDHWGRLFYVSRKVITLIFKNSSAL